MGAKQRNWTAPDGSRQKAWAVSFMARRPEGGSERIRKSGFRTRREAEAWETAERERRAKQVSENHSDLTLAEVLDSWLHAADKGLVGASRSMPPRSAPIAAWCGCT